MSTEQPNGSISPIGTPKQQKAARLVAENVGKAKPLPIGKVLQKAGYSKEIQDSPDKVTRSKTFQQLLNQYIPEKVLAKKHKQLIGAVHLDHYVFPASESDDVIRKVIESVPGCKFIRVQTNSSWKRAYFATADNGTQIKALELAYKVHKKLGSNDDPDGEGGYSEEIKAVIVHIRKILPPAGQ